MFIVHFYTALLFVFTGFLNNSYAMVIHQDKNQSHRSDRQIRPVLNGIIFLLAANLVAKGTLALGGYQTPNIPNNVQGALYLTLNGPQQNPNLAQQTNPIWYPISNQIPYIGLTTQRPNTQQRIGAIHDPYYEQIIEENTNSNPIRYDNVEEIIPAASEELNVTLNSKKARLNDDISENNAEETTEYKIDDVEILPQTKQEEEEEEEDEEIEDNARQQNPTTTTTAPSTSRQSQRPMQTTLGAAPTMVTPSTVNVTTTSNQGYTFGYGPSNGNENVSITTEAPANGTMMGNVNDALQPPTNNGTSFNNSGTVYGPPDLYGPPDMYGPPNFNPYYFPKGEYGPSNGNENISFTYGPPAYQKPFFSSPEDPYLNNYYNNYYHNPSYYSDLYKYSDVLNKFYNKYQYNYPSFYNNFLGK